MTEIDFFPFLGLVRGVAAARFRTKTPTTEQARGLFDLLDDLPFEEVERALERAAAREKFYLDAPTIRAHVVRTTPPAPVPAEVAAALAAGEVHCRACDDTGWTYRQGRGGPIVSLEVAVTLPSAERWAVRCACRATNPLYRAKALRS